MPPAPSAYRQPPPGQVPEDITAAERKWLAEEGIGEQERRRRARVLRNRQSAQNSRNRRKNHVSELEDTVDALRRENESLRKAMARRALKREAETTPAPMTPTPSGDTLGLSLHPPSPGASLSGLLDAASSSSSSDGSPLFASPQLDVVPAHDRRSSSGSLACMDTVREVPPANPDVVSENRALRSHVDSLEKLVVKLLQAAQSTPEHLPTYSINDKLVVPAITRPINSVWSSPLLPTDTYPAPPLPRAASAPSDPTQDLTCHPAAMVTRSRKGVDRALQRVSSRVVRLRGKEQCRGVIPDLNDTITPPAPCGDTSIDAIDLDLADISPDALLMAYAAELAQQTPSLSGDSASTATHTSPFLSYAGEAAHDTLAPGRQLAGGFDWTGAMFEEEAEGGDLEGRMF